MPELTHAQAAAFYDRFGSRQDLQRFYEDAAIDRLLANAALPQAHAVVEFGCGTGRLAARMLDGLLRPSWRVLHRDVVCRLGLCSEVLIAGPASAATS